MPTLKPCSACTKEVAVNARRCPHCGQDHPAPGKLFSVVILLKAAPFLALGVLLICAAVLPPSPPSAIVPEATYAGPMAAAPEAAPSVASDPDPGCTYSDADREIWPSVLATDESNPEGLMRQDELQSLPCDEQRKILNEVDIAGSSKEGRVKMFRTLYESFANVNENARIDEQERRGDYSDSAERLERNAP